jgi:hypothetical protein
MTIRYGIALGAIMLASTAALAADTKTNQVTPGKAATEAVGDSVPTMKGECADQAKVDTKAPGTEATEAMDSEVPTMKQADAADCMDQPKTKTN